MATITATITVDFISNYAGAHRVCWRIQGSGDAYNCDTIVNCTGGGAACQAIITTDVNDTSCDGTVVFEGYVQAGCQDELSTEGRVAWVENFAPTPTCIKHEITCDSVPILASVITNGGYAYDIADTLTVVRDGADTATGDAIISINTLGDGIIASVDSLLNAGTGYVVSDVLTLVDGIGSGAGCTITVDSIGGSGEILTWSLTTPGTDYIGSFTFTGGSGTGAAPDGVTYTPFGEITSITITDPGNYSVIPTVSISTATGVGAVLTFTLDTCVPFAAVGNDCKGNPIVWAKGPVLGSTTGICIQGGLGALPAGYSDVQTGCCIPDDSDSPSCYEYSIENTAGAPTNVKIIYCGGTYSTLAVGATSTEVVCLVEDGIFDEGNPNLIITKGSVCTTVS